MSRHRDFMLNTLGKVGRGVFDEMDKRRKRGETRVTVSYEMWQQIPIDVRNNFPGFFQIYLIVKYKHHKAIDMRPYSIVGEDAHGIIFLLRNDVGGRGWFNNGC